MALLKTLDQMVKAPTQEKKREIASAVLPKGMTSAELMQMDFPDPVWVIPGIIPEGLTLLAGCPKVGKSWLVLNMAIALSVGGCVLGSIKIEKMTVLYLSLEDTERRLKNRLDRVDAFPSNDLHLRTEWRRGSEGIDDLVIWKEAYPETKLIIIDTLQHFRKPSLNANTYESDYDEIIKIKKLSDHLAVPITAVHHTRKMPANDPLLTVSGTLGITGAADTTLVLTKSRRQSDAELFICGRDIEDQELALRFEDGIGWTLLGSADDYRQTKERQEILDVIKQADGPVSAKSIAETLEKKYNTVKNLVNKMVKENFIRREGNRGYIYVP